MALSKALKGYDTTIKSVEDIYTDYATYSDSVERIKRYISYQYNRSDSTLKYVFLGGDVHIVPTRYCIPRWSNNFYEAYNLGKDIPSDTYFSCLGNTFNWDGNGNRVFAEAYEYYKEPNLPSITHLDDHINLLNDVYIGRLPANNSRDISNFELKRSKYERDELLTIYNKFLFGGSQLYYDTLGISDANYWGDSICNNLILNNYSAVIEKLYDTSSTFSNKWFYANDLQSVLASNCFNLINIDTHGTETGWLMKDSCGLYDVNYAEELSSPGAAFITTSACHTADYSQVSSLGKSLILNPNSNTIGFWGSAHISFAYGDPSQIGTSRELTGNFYRHLFSDSRKKIGELTYLARLETPWRFPSVDCRYNEGRFLSISVALLGDPEMEVYLSKPLHHTSVDMSISSSDVYISTLTDSVYCFIVNDTEESTFNYCDLSPWLIDYDTNHFSFSFETSFQVGITKKGYVPWQSHLDYFNNVTIDNTIFQNCRIRGKFLTLANDLSIYGNFIEVGKNVVFEVGNTLRIENNFECPIGSTLEIIPLVKRGDD